MTNRIVVGDVGIGNGPLVLIAGPCVIENEQATFDIAKFLKQTAMALNVPFIFKASYDKANRTATSTYRGPGIREGLKILEWIKTELKVPVLSDVHRFEDIDRAAEVLDCLQIPAFLCRQTDFVQEVAEVGKPVNIKKGQFLAPQDIDHVIHKVLHTGNEQILVTERGTCFGHNDLVVDFRGLGIMRQFGFPIVFDCTHSVQNPGGGVCSGGQREFAPLLAKAAVAAGADAVFMEVHPDPDNALCDGPNSIRLEEVPALLKKLLRIWSVTKEICYND
jgi:2-dehydro-3-deoxyphosphooctonate aldolase (KDO 8-P synthase)